MRSFNQIILEGAVGSHMIELGDDGLWNGQFDIHVQMNDSTVQVFDCRATESSLVKLDGIGGHDVRVEGRIMIHNGGLLDGQPYIEVGKLAIL